jgi:hypothetical protein
MKKILNLILCFGLCLVSVITLSACDSPSSAATDEITLLKDRITELEDEVAALKADKLPDFKDCEVGYQLEVHPAGAFDAPAKAGNSYYLDSIFNIDYITLTLTAKKTISENELINELIYEYPYEITLGISGTVEVLYLGQKIENIDDMQRTFHIALHNTTGSVFLYKCRFDTSGNILSNDTESIGFPILTNDIFYFSYMHIY